MPEGFKNLISKLYRLFELKTWFSDVIFSRVFKNAGFLLSGKTVTGLLGLGYLSLAAHGLGLEEFGLLILIQTYVQVVIGLTTFHSWQAVIKYGSNSINSNDIRGFQRLISFTTLLDLTGVIIGTTLAWVLAPILGPFLGWGHEAIYYAKVYSFLILFTVVATPTGILRLYDRFDLLAWQVIITPALRLFGVIIAVFVDAPIWAYLIIWFIASIVGGFTLVFLGWKEGKRQGVLVNMNWSVTGVRKQHKGIIGFCFASNFNSSLQLVTGHLSTIIVGFIANPATAGLFKVAREVATAITKPAELLTQSIYPEFAKLGTVKKWSEFSFLLWRSALTAGLSSIIILFFMVFLGKDFLNIFFGIEFQQAYSVLLLLVISACITIVGFSFDPALYAMGLPGLALRVNAFVVILVYLPMLVLFTKFIGLVGPGIALLSSTIITFISLGFLVNRKLRHKISKID